MSKFEDSLLFSFYDDVGVSQYITSKGWVPGDRRIMKDLKGSGIGIGKVL